MVYVNVHSLSSILLCSGIASALVLGACYHITEVSNKHETIPTSTSLYTLVVVISLTYWELLFPYGYISLLFEGITNPTETLLIGNYPGTGA